ncbi:hypothetical protein [Gordonia zhaorongruii]|nr:hypothetical protein [Gordonia zhaorongruii]
MDLDQNLEQRVAELERQVANLQQMLAGSTARPDIPDGPNPKPTVL